MEWKSENNITIIKINYRQIIFYHAYFMIINRRFVIHGLIKNRKVVQRQKKKHAHTSL